jgi:hypothetical protein
MKMAATRRTQLLMDTEEYKRLEAEARRRGCSVGELVRLAVRQTYLMPNPEKGPIVDALLGMNLPRMDWKRAKKDIESGHENLH